MASAEKALHISQDSQSTLAHLSSLLHLFHHRNKNQHRRSIWWRHFSLLRKNLSHLSTTIDQLNTLPTTNLARTQKKRSDALLIANHEKRLVFWRDAMVPRWQRAFSQVVADGRFAVLGVVLMAVLAEVCAVVGVTVELEELGQGEVERVLEEFGREEWGEGGVMRGEGEDRGELVTRVEDDESEKVEMGGSTNSKPPEVPKSSKKRSSEAPEKKTKKKRKKTGNAIDDIFG
ncbi:hypothetical protein M409DRAFT_16720 [Zasmidium cellare ATCC 36951]|uniref:RNase MRP protein 1 RNA binding domain-containing protein n=1 Tax=Zasmidium cellare ATCC 36951 TaxID=1080233 RepID=A0A6A6D0Q1_ZASCE|nr:uncharacterized protein M409DRAFT_16720 [Zasmidium cellare ATCC 36951]KAF2172755.1 hypothetical protein M409DRAFT_16720 [Zasmidium cellare ATCC 36951]